MGEEFLKSVYKSKCEIQEIANRTAVADIEAGVRGLLTEILKRLKENRPEFDVAEIIPTGSFYEGTKLGAPDEFDFMLTLAKLSGPDKISLHPGCSVWYPYVKLQPGVEFSQEFMFNMVYDGRRIDKDYLGNPRLLVHEFWNEIEKVLDNNNFKSFKQEMPQGTMYVQPYKGRKLQFLYQHNFVCKSFLPENLEFEKEKAMLLVHSLTIGVDLMLAVKHPSVESILQIPGFPFNFENLLRTYGCQVIPKSCHTDHMAQKHCWFVTFSCIERELMNNMDLHHKKCYKILKSLVSSEINISRKCMNLSSYTLKTAFLFHVYGETKCLHPSTLSACIGDVLEYLSSNLCQTKMPCFFARGMNTWGHTLETPRFDWSVSENFEESKCAFKLCWIKLMDKYLKYLRNIIISKKMPFSGKDLKSTVQHCDYFKAAVEKVIKHYSRNKGFFELEGKTCSLELCTDSFFFDYIQKLKVCHNIDLFFLE